MVRYLFYTIGDLTYQSPLVYIVRLKPDGTRWRTGGEVKGKLTNGVGSQYSHTTSERGISGITNADAHTSAASSGLKWRPRRFKWTRPFWRKTKSGFCACAIRFQTRYTYYTNHKPEVFLLHTVTTGAGHIFMFISFIPSLTLFELVN